jgi:hypothetical protein
MCLAPLCESRDDSRVGADPVYFISMETVIGFKNLLLSNPGKIVKLGRFRVGSNKVHKFKIDSSRIRFLAILKIAINC